MAREQFLKRLSSVLRQTSRFPAGGTRAKIVADEMFANGDQSQAAEAIAGYDPADFADWPKMARADLDAAILGYRKAINPARDPAKAVDALNRLAKAVGPAVRDEWMATVEEFIGQAESWARARDWAVRRYPKQVEETLLGHYDVSQLLIHRRDGRVMLDPIARFVAGGTGLVDAYAMPSLGGRAIVRRETQWELLPATGNGRPRTWSEAVFEDLIRTLLREAQ